MKIAVLVGGIAYEMQKRLLRGIMKYADEQNISIYVFTCNGDIYRQSEYGMGEYQIFNLPDLTQYDGIIFVRDTIQNEKVADEITEKIRAAKTPAISIDNTVSGMSVFYVDNREAMREMVTHLIEVHGVKNICYLSGPRQNPESEERLKGAMEAANEHGLLLDENNIYYGNYWMDSGKRLVEQLTEDGRKLPEAIVYANDDMALGVYLELHSHNIQIGKDILLTGYDHISDAADLAPAITTIEKPQVQIGYEACKSLAEGSMVQKRKFHVKCCYRGSCGCQERESRKLSEVQMKNVKHKIESVNMAEINKSMGTGLNDCDNLQDFCECLKKYIVPFDFTFVYLCLCEEETEKDNTEYDYKIRTDYAERMYVPIAYEEGCFTEYSYFSSKEILPEICKEKLKGKACIVAPVHFRRNCLGYCVMCGSELPFNSAQFQNWIMNMSNALENIRKQGELKRLVKVLNRVWMLDNLTQLYNRAGFFHYADRLLEACRSHNTPIGILFADINKLKQVNDGYGHEEGDFYIKSVAVHLKNLKKEGQLIMRYGGDEFVVLGELVNGDEFADYIDKLNLNLNAYARQHEKPYDMSVSIGFRSVLITKEFKLDRLMEEADREMYKMKKKKGRAEI